MLSSSMVEISAADTCILLTHLHSELERLDFISMFIQQLTDKRQSGLLGIETNKLDYY